MPRAAAAEAEEVEREESLFPIWAAAPLSYPRGDPNVSLGVDSVTADRLRIGAFGQNRPVEVLKWPSQGGHTQRAANKLLVNVNATTRAGG